MRAALLTLIILALGVAGAMWLADLGGSVDIKVGEHWIGAPFPIAMLLALAAFVALHWVLNLFGAMRRWPERLSFRRAGRHRAEGDAALTRALVALAAGTAPAAKIELEKAAALLGRTPQILLLTAEAERMEGRDEAAAAIFRQLAETEDARFLGLRGLLRQAMARGDWDAALALAKEAEANQPGAAWLREERTQLAISTRNWREALALAPAETPKAALALAAAAQEPDTAKAGDFEKQAFQADPGFAPAALAWAKRLKGTGNPKRSRVVLEDAWAASPHPDLAVPYLEGEADALARVKAADALIARNPTHPESRILLSTMAIRAGLLGRARGALEALVKSGAADRRAYLLLAELEEAEHGETPEGRLAQGRWLREAANAPAEPHWRCAHCGKEHMAWAPVCDACDTVGQIAWSSAAVRPAPAGGAPGGAVTVRPAAV